MGGITQVPRYAYDNNGMAYEAYNMWYIHINIFLKNQTFLWWRTTAIVHRIFLLQKKYNKKSLLGTK